MESSLVKDHVNSLFVSGKYNCAMTVLEVLSASFDTPLEPQVIYAAQAMPGAGGVGDLCGLVSGVLMYIGLWGGQHGLPRAALRPVSSGLVQVIQGHFGSIACRDLRPEDGCGDLAVGVLDIAIPYLAQHLPLLLDGE